MHKIPTYILVICGFLVMSLMAVSLLYIWFPEVISGEAFVKVGVSFAVILIGSVLMALIGRSMRGEDHNAEDKGSES
ncbi:MAG: hypothetical protein KDI90_12355 [Alphaproteobacteria bacterium]|nr:hypothetical protein [Alphaproteobacteria bacterium]